MLAAGLPMHPNALHRFQQHVASGCALPWLHPQEGLVRIVLPSLRRLLDSSAILKQEQPISNAIASAADVLTKSDVKTPGKATLIGSIIVPAVIDFTSVLGDWDHLARKTVLDILLVVFYKVSPIHL